MNCCDDYGQCKQGHGFPARETKMTHTTESLMELRKLAVNWRDYKLNNLSSTAEHIGMLFVHKRNFEQAINPDSVIELLDAITELVAERDALTKNYEARELEAHELSEQLIVARRAPSQLAELQSGDELPEPAIAASKLIPERSVMSDALYTETQVRQAVAMARAKLLAELGKVEAVAWQCRRRDNEEGWGLWRECSSAEAVRFQAYGPNYEVRSLYTRPLPAQDVNAELLTSGNAMREAFRQLLEATGIDETTCFNFKTGDGALLASVSLESIFSRCDTALANAKAAQQKGGV